MSQSAKTAPSAVMKAVQAASFGTPSATLTVSSDVARPPPPPKGHVQIAVAYCSLSPSEYRMLSGDASLFKKPRSGHFPYIPGGDVSGVVVAAGPGVTDVPVGSRVMATWEGFGEGGLAEFVNVERSLVAPLPTGLDLLHGAAVVDSSANAMLAAEDAKIASGDKVLVLGGSGAVGTALVQIARKRGAATIVATSTDAKLVGRLGADEVVNYREEKWWESEAVRAHAPFDVVVDCAEGSIAFDRVKIDGLLKTGKEGGRFLAVVVNEWQIEMKTVWQALSWFGPVIARSIASCWNSASAPKYTMFFPAQRGDSLKRLVKLVEEGWLEVVIDKDSPLPFTTDGVRQAFDTMIARRAHGKVVVKIRDEAELQ